MDNFDMMISSFDLFAALIAGAGRGTRVFFQVTKIGRALRAVADDHQAALSVGIPLKHIWAIVWSVAGFVALVAGLMWGARSGVQFALTFIALKALPVLILGGFDSVPGAIVGGLIIGARRNSPKSISARSSAAASKAGSPTCSRCCSCWCGRRGCSARSTSTGSMNRRGAEAQRRRRGKLYRINSGLANCCPRRAVTRDPAFSARSPLRLRASAVKGI
jgi:hypothetical protein